MNKSFLQWMCVFSDKKLMIGSLILGLLLSASQMSFAQDDPCKPLEETAGFKEVRNLVDNCKITSVNQFLDYVPKSYRENFTLVYSSMSESEVLSPGTVTPKYPRAILFGGNGKMMITFTSNPNKPSINQLQILDEDPTTHQSSLHLVKLGPHSSVEDNPQSCKKCHSEDTHPIWAEYPDWKGVYGSHDDILNSTEDGRYDDNAKEYTDYKIFLKAVEADPNSPFKKLDQESLKNHYHISAKNGDGEVSRSTVYTDRPNTILTNLLSNMEASHIVQTIRNSPHYPYLKDILLSDYNGCTLTETSRKKALKKIKAKDLSAFKFLSAPAHVKKMDPELTSPVTEDYYNQILNLLGYDPKSGKQSLDSEAAGDYQTGLGDLKEMVLQVLAYEEGFDHRTFVLNDAPDFLKRVKLRSTLKRSNLGCEKLISKIDSSNWLSDLGVCNVTSLPLQELQKTIDAVEESRKSPFHSCVECHTGDMRIGPEIHFDNFTSLELQLKNDPTLKSRIIDQIDKNKMPKSGQPLSPFQKQRIKDYLK